MSHKGEVAQLQVSNYSVYCKVGFDMVVVVARCMDMGGETMTGQVRDVERPSRPEKFGNEGVK